jgi:hypothetical protein
MIVGLVVAETLWVIQLKGGERAQDIFVLFPLCFGYFVSLVHSTLLFIAFQMHRREKRDFNKKFFIIASISVLMPIIATPILFYVIVLTS